MKTIASNLSPRGWALLVLAGGSTLAIPFFKGSSSDRKYSTVSPTTSIKPDDRALIFNPLLDARGPSSPSLGAQVIQSPSSTIAPMNPSNVAAPTGATQNGARASVDIGAGAERAFAERALAGQSSAGQASTEQPGPIAPESLKRSSNSTTIYQPKSIPTTPAPSVEGRSVGLADSRRTTVDLNPNTSSQVEELPKPTSGTSTDPTLVISQPRSIPQTNAAVTDTEFPSWAKKPSLLDSLLVGKPSSSDSEQDTQQARKPTSFQTWADNNTQGASTSASAEPADRYTPFGAADQNISLTSNESTAELRWPDEDPRTAVAIVQPPKLVGRDAMIRDPEKLQSPSSNRSPAMLSATVSSSGTASTSPSKEFGKAPATITQPRFGEQPESVEKPRASLRSQLPPDEQQIIRQPSLKSDLRPKA